MAEYRIAVRLEVMRRDTKYALYLSTTDFIETTIMTYRSETSVRYAANILIKYLECHKKVASPNAAGKYINNVIALCNSKNHYIYIDIIQNRIVDRIISEYANNTEAEVVANKIINFIENGEYI